MIFFKILKAPDPTSYLCPLDCIFSISGYSSKALFDNLYTPQPLTILVKESKFFDITRCKISFNSLNGVKVSIGSNKLLLS